MFELVIKDLEQKSKLSEAELKSYTNFLLASEVNGISYPFFTEEVFYLLSDDCYNSLGLGIERVEALLKAAFRVAFLISNLKVSGIKLDNLYNSSQKKVYYIKAFSGDRIATKSEVENRVEELFEHTIYSIDKGIATKLGALLWAQFGIREVYESLEIGKALDTFGYKAPSDSLSNIDGIFHLIITALDWAESDAFSKDISKLKANKKRFDMFEYLDYAEDEVTDGVSFSTLIDFADIAIRNEKQDTRNYDIITHIIRTYRKYHRVSARQERVIREYYSKKNIIAQNADLPGEYSGRVEKIYSTDLERCHLTAWERTFIRELRKGKREYLSVKQMRIINQLYADIESEAWEEFKEFGEPADTLPDETKRFQSNLTIDDLPVEMLTQSAQETSTNGVVNPWDDPRLLNPIISNSNNEDEAFYPYSSSESDDDCEYDSIFILD